MAHYFSAPRAISSGELAMNQLNWQGLGMKLRDLFALVCLAAIWGASFLFLHLAVPQFGAIPLAFVRMASASLFLLPLLLKHRSLHTARGHWRHLILIGFMNFALPFSLWAFAMQILPAGLASVLNATTPLWGSLIAALWLQDSPSRSQLIGLLLGFVGVAILAAGKDTMGSIGSVLAMLAALLATLAYGLSANYTKHYLGNIPSMTTAGVSQICASLWLLPLACWQWPAQAPHLDAWACVMALGILCTGIANLLYFGLIKQVGPAKAMTTTFMIPAFGILWGSTLLKEPISLTMLAGCMVILAGTLLATGAWRLFCRRN